MLGVCSQLSEAPGQPQPSIDSRVLLATATLESQEELTPLSGRRSAQELPNLTEEQRRLKTIIGKESPHRIVSNLVREEFSHVDSELLRSVRL